MRFIQRVAVCLAAFSLSGPAFAEENTTPFRVVDEFVSGFPAEQSTDVLGVSLGMSSAEVFDIAPSKFPPIKRGQVELWHRYNEVSYTLDLRRSDDLGPIFTPTVSTLNIYTDRPAKSEDRARMSFVYGSGATAGRLQAMARNVYFNPRFDRDELVAALIDKYGVEQSDANTTSSEIELRVAYVGGRRIPAGDPRVDNCEASKVRGEPIGVEHDREIYGFPFFYYMYQKSRPRADELSGGCDAIIRVVLSHSYKDEEDIKQMTIHVIDHLAIHQDVTAVDRQMEAASAMLPPVPLPVKPAPEL